jgi:hypothetical protein
MCLQDSGRRHHDPLGLLSTSTPARPRPSTWPAPDTIPTLTRRISELDARIQQLEAELAAERQSRARLTASDRAVMDALADVQRSIESVRAEQTKLAEEVAAIRGGALGAVLPPASSDVAPADAASAFADREELLNAIFSQLAPVALVAPVGRHRLQLVIAPLHSFPRLLDIEHRLRSLTTVVALELQDFRDGTATFALQLSEAISPAEFGAVVQMITNLRLRPERTTQSSVELRAEDAGTAS